MTWQTLMVALFFMAVFSVLCQVSFASAAERIRPSPIAGSWYPGTKAGLQKALDGYLRGASLPEDLAVSSEKLVALILPHAGYTYSGPVAAKGAKLIAKGRYDRVILIGPTHRGYYQGASVPTFTHYETPLGRVELDRAVCDALLAKKGFQSEDRLDAQEHSIEILLPWIQDRLGAFKFVPVMVGDIDAAGAARLADAIRPFVDSRTLLVASSDFVHYGAQFQYTTREPDVKGFITRIDLGAVPFIEKGDPDGFLDYCQKTGATICGHNPIAVLLNVLGKEVKAVRVAYARSGDEEGNYTQSVSYMSVAFFANGAASSKPASKKVPEERAESRSALKNDASEKLTDYEKKVILSLARQTLEQAAKDGSQIQVPKHLPDNIPHLLEKRGVFVTLQKKGQLRGCIGYIQTRVALIEGVRDNAFNAAMRDNRFSPVRSAEAKDIDIEISVLTPMKRVSNYKEIEVGKHGVVVRSGYNQGVFLPQVAPEQGWNREQMLEALCLHKAGLGADAYKDPQTELWVFEAEVFGEKEHAK